MSLGIHDWCVFYALLNLITPALPDGLKLSKFQMVMMFFLKIRLSLYDEDIAYRFGVHVSTVSRNFHRVLDIMFVYTSGLARQRNAPLDNAFKFSKNCAIIIDCSEVFIERPSDLLARAQVWSNYKHNSTIKFRIGITPHTLCWWKNVR